LNSPSNFLKIALFSSAGGAILMQSGLQQQLNESQQAKNVPNGLSDKTARQQPLPQVRQRVTVIHSRVQTLACCLKNTVNKMSMWCLDLVVCYCLWWGCRYILTKDDDSDAGFTRGLL